MGEEVELCRCHMRMLWFQSVHRIPVDDFRPEHTHTGGVLRSHGGKVICYVVYLIR